jgi:actin related protein 2/3 complex subunit 5
MAAPNYRTVNVDIYDAESPINFPLATLQPSSLPAPTSAAAAASIAQQVRQLLRSGDSAGALAGALDTAPLGGDDGARQVHLTTVVEVLQGIRQSDVAKVLESVLAGPGGRERGDTLMKYLYRGMGAPSGAGKAAAGGGGVSPQMTGSGGAAAGTTTTTTTTTGGFSQIQARNLGEAGSGQAMSVLLSWHEKLVEIVGVGGIVRVMCDRRTV